MREKIVNALTMLRKKKVCQPALTAESRTFPTGCVHSVDSIKDEPLLQKQSNIPRIGIDFLGGDFISPCYMTETLNALYLGIKDPFCLTVFATPSLAIHIEKYKKTHSIQANQLEVIQTDEIIQMDDDPLYAIRKKKKASMCLGMKLLKEKKIDALVSTGNTGALIASAKMHLPLLSGISRAALITLLPTQKHPVAVIDVGANIHCTPKHLLHFAQMGLAYQKSRGIKKPLIGLLNIGTEEKKGRAELRETYQLLQKFNENEKVFAGNIEGKEVFFGDIHVLVTDGFTGNVFLKTAEGISSFILDTLHKNIDRFPFSKSLIERLEAELYSAEYPGAILCGVEGIIMKCHGDSKPKALKSGVQGALNLVQGNFLEKIKAELQSSI